MRPFNVHSPVTLICLVSNRKERVDKSVVFPDPEVPIIAQNPPAIEPDTLFNNTLGGLVLVVTSRFSKLRVTGELSGEKAEYVFVLLLSNCVIDRVPLIK